MVQGMHSYIYDIKKHFKFSKSEIRSIIITIAILSFMVGFDDGKERFVFGLWLLNLFGSFLIMTLAVLVHISGQKLFALWKGYEVKYKMWFFGLMIGLVAVLMSNGKLWWVFLPGSIIIKHMEGHRLGKFRYGLNYFDLGLIALSGPLANILLATIFKNIELYLPFLVINSALLHKVFLINWVYALMTFLPIPPLDGAHLMYASRLTYSFVFGSIAGYVFLIYTIKSYSFIWALLLGAVVWLVYLIYFEKAVK